MIYLDYSQTNDLIRHIFAAYGFTEAECATITDAFLAADLAGIESHGIQRMIRYDDAIRRGMVDTAAVPETTWETPISAVIDAHRAMGQLVSCQAMQKAIEKAKTSGIGMVTVRNSNHFGIAGYYARMATKQGLIGLAMTNSEAIMVPTNSRQAMLGTNPIAVAFPADPVPFCFDAATTVVTRGKMEVYNKAEKKMPEGWAVDSDGTPCSDPGRVITNIKQRSGGGILPLGGNSELLGGHKGYGWGMVCELCTSVLSGGVPSFRSYKDKDTADTAHAFFAIDPCLFGDKNEILASCSSLLDNMRHAKPVSDGQRIYIHGEKELESKKHILSEGIPANEKTVNELRKIAASFNIPFIVETK